MRSARNGFALLLIALTSLSYANEVSPNQLDEEMEEVKKALVNLKRDLAILEEDLLFPASSQVSVFLSMDHCEPTPLPSSEWETSQWQISDMKKCFP